VLNGIAAHKLDARRRAHVSVGRLFRDLPVVTILRSRAWSGQRARRSRRPSA